MYTSGIMYIGLDGITMIHTSSAFRANLSGIHEGTDGWPPCMTCVVELTRVGVLAYGLQVHLFR